jgi:hypothetical protein
MSASFKLTGQGHDSTRLLFGHRYQHYEYLYVCRLKFGSPAAALGLWDAPRLRLQPSLTLQTDVTHPHMCTAPLGLFWSFCLHE